MHEKYCFEYRILTNKCRVTFRIIVLYFRVFNDGDRTKGFSV